MTLGQSTQPEAGCFFCFFDKDGFSKSFGECSSIVTYKKVMKMGWMRMMMRDEG